jgi:rubrerythrin
MLSQEPIDLKNVKKEDLDEQILRVGMIAELNAVSLYQQLATMTNNDTIKTMLLDVIKEEKNHLVKFKTFVLKKN